jgi:hypothetical protein
MYIFYILRIPNTSNCHNDTPQPTAGFIIYNLKYRSVLLLFSTPILLTWEISVAPRKFPSLNVLPLLLAAWPGAEEVVQFMVCKMCNGIFVFTPGLCPDFIVVRSPLLTKN